MRLEPRTIYAVFGASMVLALSGVGFITKTAIDRDRAEVLARAHAELEENVRLALWRMDSDVAALIAAENARPYFNYASFYALDRAYVELMAEPNGADRLTPSPLLTEPPTLVRLHFQYGEDGEVRSPRVPPPRLRAKAERFADSALIEESEVLLGLLASEVSRERIEAPLVAVPVVTAFTVSGSGAVADDEGQYQVAQNTKNSLEWTARSRSVRQVANYNPVAKAKLADDLDSNEAGAPAVALPPEAMTPVWVDDRLLLVRRVQVGSANYLQGAWLDWEALQKSLALRVQDILPNAELAPVKDKRLPGAARLLASIPVELVPGALPTAVDGGSTLWPTLIVAWLGVLFAGVAFAVLLMGATALSERRADFVSAVTHELRTPLTTFRMYTEMLADGMVKDEGKRAAYLETLRREAIRLGHLVENVLSYARIERGRASAPPERIALPALVKRFEPRLCERAEQVDMMVVTELSEADAIHIVVDAAAVEQVLFNLVDNACKYAADAEDGRIHIQASADARRAMIRVFDHGRGISSADRKNLFSPFSRSAERAAGSAPGVGLGLALCRRLARAMGGDLRYDPPPKGGAGFVLQLPRA